MAARGGAVRAGVEALWDEQNIGVIVVTDVVIDTLDLCKGKTV